MKDNRKPGQSLLDYLWVNYGQYYVSDALEDNIIPSGKLLKDLTDGITQESISDIKVINNTLVGNNKFGKLIFSIDILEIIDGGRTITNFGKRYITLEDIDKGCEYSKNTPVYFLKFSDNSELLAPIDNYSGLETNSIVVTVSINNEISAKLKINNLNSVVPIKETPGGVLADLKISEDVESIELTKELDGLKAKIILDNSGRTLKFKYLTLSDYSAITNPDITTVYFIKDKKYFYFGKYLIGEGTTNLDNYYTKQEIDENLATKTYVEDKVAEVSGLSWNNLNLV